MEVQLYIKTQKNFFFFFLTKAFEMKSSKEKVDQESMAKGKQSKVDSS